ncbi:MAG TPA: AAA family ATPase [Gammaproteobacteria bacterium]|nr:AAA family ATPase [Gammaproteobacteria bacterium]
MYEAHFGLKKPVFDSGIAQDAGVFLGPKHAEIAANCKRALTTSDSAVVLTGPAGVGKTTFVSAVLRTTSTRLALGWITVAPANAAELLELLLAELGMNAHRVSRAERVQMWRQVLNEMSATSSRVYVIAERADELGPDVLRALDSLTAADPHGSLGANLVLLGQPALLDLLKSPLLESLRQRIRLRQRLEPLTRDELRAYVDHHVKLAGGELDKLFARDALAALHELSGGLPRLANNLCDTALTLAATRKEPVVTAELLKHVAVDLLGIEPTQRPADSPAPRTAAEPPRPAAAPPAAARAPVAPQATPARISTPRAATPAPSAPAPSPAAAGSSAPAPQEPRPPRPARAPQAAPASSTPVSRAAGLRATLAATLAATPVPAAAAPRATATAPAPAPAPASAPAPAPAPAVAAAAADIDSLADTLTDLPDVPTLDFPVLTDAVDPPQPSAGRPRGDAADPKPIPKSIEDVSDSLAETLFNDAEFDTVSSELAFARSSADDASASAPAPARAATPKTAAPAKKQAGVAADDDPFDFLGLGRDAPLELIDDSEPAPEQRKEVARKR